MTRRDFIRLTSFSFAGCMLPRTLKFEVLEGILAQAKTGEWAALAIGNLVGRVGMSLLETPYVGQTLEVSDTIEKCVVNLEGLDCVTFFESSLGIARMIRLQNASAEELTRQITQTRYRGGMLNGYVSRLHYTSEWIMDNSRRGIVKDLSAELPGAAKFEKKIHFMSNNPMLYRQLKANADLVAEIAGIEKRLSEADMWHIPRSRIAAVEPLLVTGDIVGITTSTAGIDCSHTGLCWRDESGQLRFLHASSTAKKVVLGPRLSEYVAQGSKNLGVMIARPLDPSRKSTRAIR